MRKSASSLVLPVLVLALAGSASAQETLHWNDGGDRDWNNPDNWDDETVNTGVPGSIDKAAVWRTPTPIISSASPEIKSLDLTSVVDIEDGGTLSVNQWLIVGYGNDASGTLNINGGQTNTIGGADMSVGFGADSGPATGTVHMTGGSLRTDDLFIGRNANGTGYFNLSGATSSVTVDDLLVGEYGTGTLTMTDGSFSINDDLFVSNRGRGNGEMIMSGGVIESFDALVIGNEASSNGKMTMSRGSITGFSKLVIGLRGTGEFTMNGDGGTINTTGLLMVGEVAGSNGTLVMESGSITVGTLAYVGFKGTGLLDMTGGSITIPADKPLVVGRNNGSSGEVLLKGGTITAGALEFTAGDQLEGAILSHMDISGGTLILSGDRVGLLNGYIAAGYLTGNGSSDGLSIVYNAGADLTTVTAKSSNFPLFITPTASGYTLTWTSQVGMRYNVWSTEDLSEKLADWDLVQGDISASETSTNWPVTPAETKLFYRVEEFPPPPMTIFTEFFDEGVTPPALPAGWDTGFDPGDTLENTAWTLGTPTMVGPMEAFSGANCVGTNLDAIYGVSSATWLRSPVIDLSSATGATLVFQQWVDIDNYDLGDTGTVRVLDASVLPTVSVLEPLQTKIQGLSPDDWAIFSANLTAASLGNSVVLEFLFVSDDYATGDASGWYIDNVTVTVPGT